MRLEQEIAERTLALPRVLWIELSSRCPFDCIFCTRKSLRGAGQHMDFDLYRKLIAELVAPRIIRLNYSGESGHYPHLAEAIGLAAQSGAQTELVTALASLKPDRIEAMLRAGLNRLTLSLHTLDALRFGEIYRFSTLDDFMQRLDQVQTLAHELEHPFKLDLAFVAMAGNLHELPALAAFAAARGIGTLAVHPLIGRDPLPAAGQDEHEAGGRLKSEFARRLADAVRIARRDCAGVSIEISSPELDHWMGRQPVRISGRAVPCAGPMPDGAEIAGCDQSPFETIHVLADGSVVACEVADKAVLGDLRAGTLAEIWHGEAYRAFRLRHRSGAEAVCRACIYKQIARPQASHRLDHACQASLQLLQGFYPGEESGLLWTQRHARFWLRRRFGDCKFHLRGLLPPAPAGKGNTLSVRLVAPTDGTREISAQSESSSAPPDVLGQISNHSTQISPVEISLAFDFRSCSAILIDLQVSESYVPFVRGDGNDLRELGFALLAARCARF
jgi:MoaA/NifB/PqqE/SkfB family radical SAM enzyme